MNKNLAELCEYLNSYAASHQPCTKDQLQKAAAKEFSLTKTRSIFHREEFSVRFSSVQVKSFSNSVIGLSTLRRYDYAPFVVCVVRPHGVELLLANSTFLKKISHTSQKLTIDKVRGTFNGPDILRSYEGIVNKPENFEELFEIHAQFSWEENLARIVEKTYAIAPTGQRFEPSEEEKANILKTPEIAKLVCGNAEYVQLANDLSQIVGEKREEILEAASIENPKLRGDRLEQIITDAGSSHSLEDYGRTLTIGTDVKVDIKTKILSLKANPKGYNIEKMLKLLALGNTVFSFFFVGISIESRFIITRLVSIFDKSILNATKELDLWAGRNSRGVTQLIGNLKRVFDPDFFETIDVKQAQEFLKKLIDIPPVGP